ncbi:MAG: CdaA regulatory protein CdaR [Candidatus Dichloromethanomonas elyunquensis]|nr:MAG: CdaA regulatory protein CdaR [Candidatus Dichloromethanomonas elyunquensis]
MRDMLRRNLGYKVVSLVLAIILWIWIVSQNQTTGLFGKQTLNVPLVTYNQPSNLLIISNIQPISVQLDNNNEGISVKDLFAYVDLKDAQAGEHSYQVHMDAPEGVKIVDISPSNVIIRLDTAKDKIVPVIVQIDGAPADGYVAKQPLVTPPVVNVRGPTSILEKLESVSVEVSVTGMKESARVARPVTFKDISGKGIFAPDPNLESLHASPDTVEVVVPIYPQGTASKTVPVRVSTTGSPAEGTNVRMISPLPSQVELLGDEQTLKGIQSVSLGSVDISGLSANKVFDIPLTAVSLPAGISFAEGTKFSVMAYIGPSLASRTLKAIPVEIKNVPQGLTAEAVPAVDITVSGYPDILDAIKPGDVSAWVDAAEMQVGTYQDLAVLWKVPSGVTMVKVPKVNLVLKAS